MPEYASTHKLSRMVFRTIDITFDTPAELRIAGNNYSKLATTGTVTGFRYHDNSEPDQPPEDGHGYTMHGVLNRADGNPAARNDHRWQSAARQYVNRWIEANPDWWKVEPCT